jgi:hypothetical protein
MRCVDTRGGGEAAAMTVTAAVTRARRLCRICFCEEGPHAHRRTHARFRMGKSSCELMPTPTHTRTPQHGHKYGHKLCEEAAPPLPPVAVGGGPGDLAGGVEDAGAHVGLVERAFVGVRRHRVALPCGRSEGGGGKRGDRGRGRTHLHGVEVDDGDEGHHLAGEGRLEPLGPPVPPRRLQVQPVHVDTYPPTRAHTRTLTLTHAHARTHTRGNARRAAALDRRRWWGTGLLRSSGVETVYLAMLAGRPAAGRQTGRPAGRQAGGDRAGRGAVTGTVFGGVSDVA